MTLPDNVRHILATCRTVAVVGLSDQPHRASHGVARYLQRNGYRIVPVNPRLVGRKVLGEAVVGSLDDVSVPVDLVDVFRRTEEVLPIAEQAIRIGAKAFWQQLGVVNGQADALVRAAGLVSVMDRCIQIDHAQWQAGAGSRVA